jgi:hypothetical protein
VPEKTTVFLGLHQEDERIHGVVHRRPFIDCGFAVLKVNHDETMTLQSHKNFSRDRQVELELDLEKGHYIILPMTTGALMVKPEEERKKPRKELLKKNGASLTRAFEGVIEDIFRKFDLFIGRELSYDEFLIFYKCTGHSLSKEEFKKNILAKCCSTSEGVTVRGLKDFFINSIYKEGEDTVRSWLANLGYDEHLFNVESRSFTLTFHSVSNFKVVAKDAI